jgi:MoaA/NifB/PqqE/SkfB family radical SAM enzyme
MVELYAENVDSYQTTIPKIDSTYRPIKIVKGFKKNVIRIKLWAHLISLIYKRTDNFKAFKSVLKFLISFRNISRGKARFRKIIQIGDRYSWSIFVPPYPSKKFDKLINGEIDYILKEKKNFHPLHFIFLSITKQCPLNCEHCFEWDIMHQPETLSIDDLKNIVDQFQKRNISSIFLTGGEPLSRYQDLLEIISYSNAKSNVWLLSSGYMLDRKKALELRRAGLYGVMISVDHYDETMHNAFRGNDKAYANALEAIKSSREEGLVTAMSVCITSSFCTTENLERYMDFAREQQVTFVQFFEPRKKGRYKDKDVLLDQDEINIIETFFHEFNDSKKNTDYPTILYQGYHQRKIGCMGAGNRYLYVDSDGMIQSCPFCNHGMGNALELTDEYSIRGQCRSFTNALN